MKKKILCVFPNDPLIAYYKKGEIKTRYFNPKNIFDEIHFISLIDQDIEEEKIQEVVGNAIMKIHSVGKINLKNKNKKMPMIIELVKKINPDVIRAYNPLIEGWLAATSAQKLKIPFLLSLHTQYDANRNNAKKNNFKKFLKLKFTEKFIEPEVIKSADKIIVVYNIIKSYVLKHTENAPEVLHNKVDCKRFLESQTIENLHHPLILSVGNLITEKNHQILIKAMKNIDAHLMIIGDGYLFSELNGLIKEMGLQNKISIKKSVPHEEIQKYFRSSDVFALAYNPKIESLPMPVMEAMASGLPIVIPHPKNDFSENLENVVMYAEMNSDSFSEKLQKLLKNSDLRERLSRNAQDKSREYDIEKIEKRESEIYEEFMNND